MKNALLTFTLFTLSLLGFSQDDMPVVWESRLDHKIQFMGTGTEETGYSFAASEKELTLFDNKTGNVLWSKKFRELAPKLSKIDELTPLWESNTFFIFDRKMGKDQIACIQMSDGKLLWTTDKYQDVTDDNVVYISEKDGFAITLKKELVFIKARTGEELWSTTKFKGVVARYVITPDNHMVLVNFLPSAIEALFTGFKNQIMKINLENGDIVWENTYIGRAQRKVISKEFLLDLSIKDDKVLLRLNGLQVYNLKTGASEWSAAFDFTPDGLAGKPAGARRFGIYGAVADPVKVGDDLYVLNMSNKRSQYIHKYDVKTGNLIWKSPEIKDARAIPGMYVMDNKVVLQIGGAVEAQAYIYKSTPNADGSRTITEEWKIWFPNIKPFGVQSFNTSDGSLAWESERFRKGITNMIRIDDNVVVCSGKALYSMDVTNGKENYEVPVTSGGVGNATLIMPYKDLIVVVGEKGISTYQAKSGSLVNSGKYKSSSLEAARDKFVIMKTEGADIACFDLETCKFLEFKARKGATTTLSLDTKYVYIYENKTVTKVKTTL